MTVTVTLAAAEAAVVAALAASNTSQVNATSVAAALVAAETDGQVGHGLSRVPAYAAQAASGKVAGNAIPTVTQTAAALLRVDAGNGFAFPALDAAIAALADLTPRTGIAAATVARSHHFGQAGHHVERLAERGLVALMVGNSPRAIAPWGGRDAVFGTNPIAFAAPRAVGDPLVVDLSLSKVARGRIMAAAQRGEPIPEGWALDADGQPTTDAQAALDGTMTPIAEAKGAALALVVEILAAALTGANFAFEASSFFTADGKPPGVGQMLIAFAPGVTAGPEFADRLELLLSAIIDQPGARLPGAGRAERRACAIRQGVTLPNTLWTQITALAG